MAQDTTCSKILFGLCVYPFTARSASGSIQAMAAAAKKEEGNRLFASKDYDGAIRAYTEVRARATGARN